MTAADILTRLRELSVVVIGDICLDRWCTYDPSVAEPSRETGIPRIGVIKTETTPGAAGTVANNLRSLGVDRVAVLGAIGDDGFGWDLLNALNARGVSAELCVRVEGRQTFTYTKLINSVTGDEDLPRVDYISRDPLPAETESQIYDNLQLFVRAFDVIMVSDQAETEHGGVITPRIRTALATLALEEPNRIVWVDSRKRPELFRNVILKPNRDEAAEACMRVFGKVDYDSFRRHTNAPFLVVTDGEAGATVVTTEEQTGVPTRPVSKPVDICGAGDSFSAGAVVALAVTGSPVSAARFGNLVASVTIMKKGTGTASPDEVLAADRAWSE